VNSSRMVSRFDESVVTVGPAGAELIGVLARPADCAAIRTVGVVIIVGGPQTRVGSHRQFVLMARALAQAGYPCLRFDYTGMGDSPGPSPDFERTEPDIRRACDALMQEIPGCARIALWGLCDGATAALFYAAGDKRIAAVIGANPWARSDATRSAALVSGHYGARLGSAEFWRRVLTGKVNVIEAGCEAFRHLMQARGRPVLSSDSPGVNDLPTRLAQALRAPPELVRLQLSGRDLTAAEFELVMQAARISEGTAVSIFRLPEADHTYSDPDSWRAIIDDTTDVLERI